ncbi:hypothetical protein [Holophaga foetida]|uniref:hypothetical protein n=1 Tax=Holophaga foetida TaxID=35839 RepID=UPI0002E8EE5D|nr:hypothetical protein [Holophaga foetida]
MSVTEINATLQDLAAQSTGFDEKRAAVLFMPGTYGDDSGQFFPAEATGQVDSPIGFMMTVQGLGASPDEVTINGNLRAGAQGQGALATFWRSLSNMKIVPIQTDEDILTMRWSTSQACPLRRLHMMGNLDLTGGQSFGTFLGNSHIEGEVRAGFGWTTDTSPSVGQAQYFTRDSVIARWQGHAGNFVFSGVTGAPEPTFAPGDKTVLDATPITREAPFLFYDGTAAKVFVPKARTNTQGIHWGTSSSDGTALPMSSIFIAQPTDTAQTINTSLASGKSVILTPGVYEVDEPLHVTKANTVIMGLGMATVTPTTGTAAIVVDDVPGVILSALIVDSNAVPSQTLIQVGPTGAHLGEASNPTTLSDIFVRIPTGAAYAGGGATTSVEVNQNHVLIDHTWLWRGDHNDNPEDTTGWTINLADHGLVVNGDDVTAMGLYVEHYQKEQVIWNGNGGRTIFLESEFPYDVPDQASWMSGTKNGYPVYLVADSVTSHNATGLCNYALFFASFNPMATAPSAHCMVQAPTSADVLITNVTAGIIAGRGGYENIINDDGITVNDTTGPTSFLTGMVAIGQTATNQ